MRLEGYLQVIGCGSREGGVWKGDVAVVAQAVGRKRPPLQETGKRLTAANAKPTLKLAVENVKQLKH